MDTCEHSNFRGSGRYGSPGAWRRTRLAVALVRAVNPQCWPQIWGFLGPDSQFAFHAPARRVYAEKTNNINTKAGRMMAMKRNETGVVQNNVRSSRMFRDNQRWYFRTREGQSIGPFADELEASTQLEVYIRLVEMGLLPAANT